MIGRVWLIGCGNMGGAMLRRWIASGVVASGDVAVLNRADRDLPPGVRQTRSLPQGPLPDAIMLAVKPQQIDEIAERWGQQIAEVPVLISILAGVEEAAIARRFRAGAIIRAMPNLPVAVGKGVVALHGHRESEAGRAVEALMAPLGLVEWIADASLFDAVTALAGSGPAFLYRFIDALAQGGAALGLPTAQAERLALATVEGAALLAAGADNSPATLATQVASPGGSTRAGLDILDREDALVRLLEQTLAAATRRNAEMAAAAR